MRSVLRGPDTIAYANFAGRPAGADVLALVRAGIGYVVTIDVDDSPGEWCRLITEVAGGREIARLLAEVASALSPPQLSVVRRALLEGPRLGSTEELANTLGASARSIRRWTAGPPRLSPNRLLAWGRVLHTARLVSKLGLPIPDACERLGVSDPRSFRRDLRRLMGLRPETLPAADLYDHALASFRSLILTAG